MSVRCVACGAENPDGSQYCRSCARKLDPETTASVVQRRSQALATQSTGVRWLTVIITTSAAVVVVVVIALVLVLLVH